MPERNGHRRAKRCGRHPPRDGQRQTPCPAHGGFGERARQRRFSHGRMGCGCLHQRFSERADAAGGIRHHLHQPKSIRDRQAHFVAALLLRLRRDDSGQYRRLFSLHAIAANDVRLARVARDAGGGRLGKRISTSQLPRRRRARRRHAGLEAQAVCRCAAVVLGHGDRGDGPGRHQCSGGHQSRLHALQSVARRRPLESCREAVPHRPRGRSQ